MILNVPMLFVKGWMTAEIADRPRVIFYKLDLGIIVHINNNALLSSKPPCPLEIPPGGNSLAMQVPELSGALVPACMIVARREQQPKTWGCV